MERGEPGFYHDKTPSKFGEPTNRPDPAYKVEKGHHFKKGDFVMLKVGAKAYAITAIDTSEATYDTITVGTTLGEAVKVGDALVQASAQSASKTSAFKYAPKALVGDSYEVKELDNHIVVAVTIGQFKESIIPAQNGDIKAALTGIVLI